jgi:hypothetical protein
MLTGMPWPSTLPPHRILRAPILTRVRACAWPGADDGEADGGATDGGAAGRAAGSAAGGVSGGARSGAAAGGATGSAAGSRVATKRTKPEDMVSPDRPAPRSRVSWADVTRSPQRTPATHGPWAGWLKMPSALLEDSAPRARPSAPRAQVDSTKLRAQPPPLECVPCPQVLALACAQLERFPLSNARCAGLSYSLCRWCLRSLRFTDHEPTEDECFARRKPDPADWTRYAATRPELCVRRTTRGAVFSC